MRTDAPNGSNAFFSIDFSSRNAPTITTFTSLDFDNPATMGTNENIRPSITAVPEPSTLWLLSVGLCALIGRALIGHALWKRERKNRLHLRRVAISTSQKRG